MGPDLGGDQRGQSELHAAAGQARKQQLRGTGRRAGCEVIPVCNKIGAESNSKNLSRRSVSGRDLSNVTCCCVQFENESAWLLRSWCQLIIGMVLIIGTPGPIDRLRRPEAAFLVFVEISVVQINQ